LEGDDELDAGATFDALSGNPQKLVRSRMDYWLGGGIHDRYFHGWREPKHRDCFVFKWDERRVGHRLYGFLCNPIARSDAGFQTCVLLSHANKKEWETDFANLDRVIVWQQDLRTKTAIADTYPEYGDAYKWEH
jgi:hypothetical protein